MADFTELAKALSQKQSIDTDEQLNELKAQKASINEALDIAISKANITKTQQKAEQNKIKFEEKRQKLKADLIKQMVDQQANQGPVAIGGNLVSQFAPEVEPSAENLPMIDMNAKA